jgi:imidazolonepropionase-like amidohydrolase
VLTVTRGVIANGTVLIRDEKIAAVGANVAVPAGAERVDATGRFVSPGGSIEKGKLANLTVTDGDLFAEKTTIKHVFVDGRLVRIEAQSGREDR